ncbi:N-acetylmuramic acid 6-phosphate etherase [Inhella proteolytica]|uniref:N-acetylmuramic acid 6-phosphate etherase n=1 Tax=Inhella proteolytica TaxID=2795029 RepID=A0A931J2W1_9BURK|nr:N-acetylmuramic acid 6-phosphate etherase [Inhella proteolytica]MBH9576554.1 N-acetylmuramic acid 6-phosphate etherase [Inhella proteolytica]
MLNTETPSPRHPDLDSYPTGQLVQAFVDDQLDALRAVQAAAPALARAVEAALPRLQAGGRLIYVGAGTSGRLGLLDGVELTPTFSWPPERACALIAGGPGALMKAVEGAEDNASQGAADLQQLQPRAQDVVIGLAASGATPYVLGALQAARAAGCLTIGMANNPGAPVCTQAEIGVVLDSGPEIISGSTRLKAGTAQKIALNTFSSSLMVKLHKVHGNLMVDLQATNAKLRRRALALTQRASGAAPEAAELALAQAGGQVKLAILMLRRQLTAPAAKTLLERHAGHLRAALDAA